MEWELLAIEIEEFYLTKEDAIKKVVYYVEWHYELTGEKISWDFIIEKISEQIEKEKYIYDAVEVFYEDCLAAYEDTINDLFN